MPIAVMLALWYSATLAQRAQRGFVFSQLPSLPETAGQPAAFSKALDDAVNALGAKPSGQNVGWLGQLYQANDYYDRASVCYETARILAPAEPRWPYFLAYLMLMKGKTGSDVQPLLDDTIRLDPTYVPALLRRAENSARDGAFDMALADYRRCLELKRSSPHALLGIARIQVNRNQWDDAEASLKDALKADPGFGAAYRLLASVYGHFGKSDEQSQALAKADAAGRFLPPTDPWVQEVEEQCYKVDKLLVYAFAASKIKKWDRARDLYERVITIDPADSEAYWRLGNILLERQETARAVELLQKAVDLGLDDETRYPIVYNNIGRGYIAQRRLDDAAKAFRRAIEFNPDFELAEMNLASVLTQLGKPEEAIKHCERAVAINPLSDGAQYNWGVALLKLGDPDSAVVHFSAAIANNPRLAAAHYQLGVYFERHGGHERAVKHFRDALETTTDPVLAARIRAILAYPQR